MSTPQSCRAGSIPTRKHLTDYSKSPGQTSLCLGGRDIGSGNLWKGVPEYDKDQVREVIEGAYRIIYYFRPDQIDALAVIHAAM